MRLLEAAGELIAELGWGRVTTRAVADRAGLPHGAVSYHFAGKQELLTDAAVLVFERAFPVEDFESLDSLEEMLALMERWMEEARGKDSVVSGIGVETLLEASRDSELRDRVGAMLDRYRAMLLGMVEAERDRGADLAGASPRAVATLIPAAIDGLFLHALLDSRLEIVEAMAAFRALLLRSGK
jgi:AcrR family transcriptional regulator